VVAIAGGVQDRHAARRGMTTKLSESLQLGVELEAVGAAEFLKTLGTMVKPGAELIAGCEIASPVVELCSLARIPRGQMWSISTRRPSRGSGSS